MSVSQMIIIAVLSFSILVLFTLRNSEEYFSYKKRIKLIVTRIIFKNFLGLLKFSISLKYISKVGLILLVVLVLLNPGMGSFKDFQGNKLGKKRYNFIIFSLYEGCNSSCDDCNNCSLYIGVLQNFFKIQNSDFYKEIGEDHSKRNDQLMY